MYRTLHQVPNNRGVPFGIVFCMCMHVQLMNRVSLLISTAGIRRQMNVAHLLTNVAHLSMNVAHLSAVEVTPQMSPSMMSLWCATIIIT